MTRNVRSILAACVLIIVALGVAACGASSMHAAMGHDSQVEPHSAERMGTGRDADVMFTREMIPHHEQAVEMSDLAMDPTRGASPRVRDLARRIKAAQSSEIQDMKSWLAECGTAEGDDGHMVDDGHTDHAGMGMLSNDAMAKLRDSQGETFDRLWLQGMIVHHEGALMMAAHIAERGGDARVGALSENIKQSQTAEIDEMRSLLGE
jgi:uncharacterized protein (DUF305 family)